MNDVPDWMLYVKLTAEVGFVLFIAYFLWATRKRKPCSHDWRANHSTDGWLCARCGDYRDD